VSQKIEITTCIVCGGNTLTTELHTKDWLVSHEDFEIKNCDNCGFRFTSNPPAAGDAGPYYETEEYVEHSDNKEGLTNTIYHYARKWMLKYKFSLVSKYAKGKRLLDIGSGSGYFINHMKQWGYAVNGVEISDKAVAFCQTKFDITAYSPEQFIADEISGEFDVATMWHVFEHVYSYDEYFSMLHKKLAADGTLIIATPNHLCLEEKYYRKFWNGYDVPRHLWHFTPSTFTQFAEKRGFKLIKMRNLPLDPFYNCMISASYKKSISLLPATVFVGFLSFCNAIFSFNKSSSIVYILKKQ
jgi:SAM-dependent methyltransferase